MEPKTTPEQKKEIAEKFTAGVKITELANQYSINPATVRKVLDRQGVTKCRVPMSIGPGKAILEFISRARSILWRQDGGKKVTYNKWEARTKELEHENGGNYSHYQSIIRASKEYPCLNRLFREYDISEYDPNPESHPSIQYFGKPAEIADANIKCEGKELSYRDNLRWAIEAAGTHLRTKQQPTSCPNDSAWYLFKQAIEEPKDFLAKVGQIESKGDGESEEKRKSRKNSTRRIDELNLMLEELNSTDEDDV